MVQIRGATIAIAMTLSSGLIACSDPSDLVKAASSDSPNETETPIPTTAFGTVGDTVVETMALVPDSGNFRKAVRASGLYDSLRGKGPFTILMPSDSSFDMLPPGAFEQLLQPENRERLAMIVRYHIIEGDRKSSDIKRLFAKSDGTAILPTKYGPGLTAMLEGDMITLTDNNGMVATIGIVDMAAGNGTVHMIDKVLMPTSH